MGRLCSYSTSAIYRLIVKKYSFYALLQVLFLFVLSVKASANLVIMVAFAVAIHDLEHHVSCSLGICLLHS
jgi:hypothetical protein